MYWIPLVVFAAHMIEEFPRFPGWATRHFGATSTAWYVYSHIVLVALIVSAGWWAETSAGTWAPLLVVAIMWSLACNAVFHVVTTVLFREYSPGVVTGVLLLVPAAVWLLWRVSDGGVLTGGEMVVAALIGTVVQIAVIGSLWLRMDIDWTGRRPAG